jgi:membrane peptidoglycan carboxypeptidase
VKTGTSEPFDPHGPNAGKIGETWALGYTPDIVVAVWAGNADNSPIDHIFSTSISFRAMRDILLEAYKGRSPTAFQVPEGIVRRQSCSVVEQAGPPNNAGTGQAQQPNTQPGTPAEAVGPTVACTSEISAR